MSNKSTKSSARSAAAKKAAATRAAKKAAAAEAAQKAAAAEVIQEALSATEGTTAVKKAYRGFSRYHRDFHARNLAAWLGMLTEFGFSAEDGRVIGIREQNLTHHRIGKEYMKAAPATHTKYHYTPNGEALGVYAKLFAALGYVAVGFDGKGDQRSLVLAPMNSDEAAAAWKRSAAAYEAALATNAATAAGLVA